jgi:hypothetical protein
MLNQKAKNVVLFGGKADLLSGDFDAAFHEVDRQVPDLENGALALLLKAVA